MADLFIVPGQLPFQTRNIEFRGFVVAFSRRREGDLIGPGEDHGTVFSRVMASISEKARALGANAVIELKVNILNRETVAYGSAIYYEK